MTRFVDRGALVAALVGVGMAVTIGASFLLVIPIEPVYWYLSIPAGLLIGYYADARSRRGAGEWPRILANAAFAGIVTGLTMAALLLVIKVLFFAADDGYRDPVLGGRLSCATGAECVYVRYREAQGPQLVAAGVTDVATFSRYYWAQQLSIAGMLVAFTTGSALVGGLVFGAARPRARADGTSDGAPESSPSPGDAART